MRPDDVLDKVITILRQELPALRKAEIGPDTALMSTGLLDSFGVVTLLAALDRALGTEIDVEQVELEQLETPAAIAALCRQASASRGGSRG